MDLQNLAGGRAVFQSLVVAKHGKPVSVRIRPAKGHYTGAPHPACIGGARMEIETGAGHSDFDIHKEGYTLGPAQNRDQNTG